MARKKVDLKAVKAKKQKKFLVVGAVLFVALLAVSVPKTMKMLHPAPHKYKHKHALAARRMQAQAAASGAAALPSVPVPSTPTGNAVLTAQLAPAAREGQLSALSATFNSKDPFRQLIDEDASSSAGAETTPPAKPDATLKVVPSSKPAATEPATPTATAPTTAPAAAAPEVHKVVLPFLSAVISVNGVRQGVDVKVDFPADAPLFHLVSLTKRTAKISVSGGSLANGKATLTLRRGQPLTLVNTADGTRYRLVLVSTSSSAAATPPADEASGTAAQTTTPTTTTPAPTAETTTTPTIGG